VAVRCDVAGAAEHPGLLKRVVYSGRVEGWADTTDAAAGTVVLGAGPAGLTAAHVLAQRGHPAMVFEADERVGGLAKTVQFNGYRFDLGGHRFFTKLKPIERLWEDTLGQEFLTRPRLSRIYFGGTFFRYPFRANDVIPRLGVVESARCALSYLWSRASKPKNPETFEEWVTMHFGRRLYDSFFRTYTDKVWGIPGDQILAEWAAQRIKNFSLFKALLSITGLRREHVTTLIEEFRYPRLGPGQMWETFQERLEARQVPVHLNRRVVGMRHENSRVHTIVVRSPEGDDEEVAVDSVISSLPLRELVSILEPAPPPEVLEAARLLRYRDYVLVALVIDQAEPFPDNWIYLHDPGTRAGRLQNFGAWSEDMVVPGTTCLGMEYFCFEGDDIWELPEGEAVRFAADELGRIGLIDPARVVDGAKVRVPKAYPMYDRNYRQALPVIREYVEGFENLKTCGRNGLHRYNNQDHSMWTAILATLNLIDGTDYDVWSVNTEADYLEEGEAVEELLDVELVV
jgi:protoporphyrinogen oxidase